MTMLSNRKNGARRKSATRTGLLAVSTVVAGLSHAMVAQADISGFSGFAPVNTIGAAVGDANIAYQGGTAFEITDGQNGEGASGWSTTAQSIVNGFTATYTYQTIPQQAIGVGNGSLQADGALLVFQSPTTGSTSAIGGGGGDLGYAQGVTANSAGIGYELFGGYYGYGGGSTFLTGATQTGQVTNGLGDNTNLSTADTFLVRDVYSGTTLTQTTIDTTTGLVGSQNAYTVNLSSLLGSATALVGFTGATGGYNSTQTISNFKLTTGSLKYAPIVGVTGFNQSVIIPASGSTTGITATLDSGTGKTGDTFYEVGFSTKNASTGLPASGSTFTSLADTSHVFTMQSYSGNDSILLNSASTTATISLATPVAYKALSFLVSTGGGTGLFNATINYSNGASPTTGQLIVSPDWFTNQPSAWNAGGRATLTATPSTTEYDGANPNLYQEDLTLTDSTDAISSISLTYESGGNINIFALSGAATSTSTVLIYTGSQHPGQFDSTSANFTNGTNVAFTNGAMVQFDDSATTANNNHSVVVASGIAPGGITFANNTSNYTFSGAGIQGTGGVTLSGTGTVTFTNSNAYTGDTSVNSGTLIIGSGGNVASNNVYVYGGGTLNVSGGTLSSSALNLNNFGGTVLYSGSTLSLAGFNGSGSFTSTNATGTSLIFTGGGVVYSGPIVLGAGSITMNAPGATATITGSNTYTGGTTLKAGTLLVGVGSLSTGTVNAAGGALGAAAAQVNVSNLVTGGTLNVASGTNTLELSNSANSLTGPLNVLSGTLQMDNPGSIGKTTVLTVASGGALLVNDSSGTAGTGATVTISGSGVNGNGALRGPDGGSGTWAGNVNVSGQATISAGNSSSLTLTGAISGTGPVLFASNQGDTGNSTIYLAPTATTYTGESQVTGDYGGFGTLTVKSNVNNALSTASGLNYLQSTGGSGYATVDLNGYNQSIQYLTGAYNQNYSLTNTGASSTLNISNGSNGLVAQTFPNQITGNLAVVKTGTGSQTFSGNNSYQGPTTISQGTLSAGSASAFGSGYINLKGGTLGLAPNLSVTPVLTNSSLSSFVGIAAAGSGDPAPTVNNGTLTLTNNVGGSSVATYYPTPVPVSDKLGFTASFTYEVTNGYADGFTFLLQNDPRGVNAVGSGGGELGYGGANSITNSAAVEFNIYSFAAAGEGTQFNSSGAVPGDANSPTGTFINTAPVNLALRQSGTAEYYDLNNPINITLVYNGPAKTLTETLYNTNELTTFTTTYTGVDYSALVGGPAGGATTAYLGFTGGEGGVASTQLISNLTYGTNVSTPQSIGNAVNATTGSSSIQLGITTGSTNTGGAVGQINISAGATVAVTAPTGTGFRGVLFTPAVSIAATGMLDLQSNDLVITGGTQTLAQVTALVASGYAGGKWNGSGIASSIAASNSAHLTALGVILNDVNGTQLYGSSNASLSPTFDGSTPADGSILVKYTYYGDANLDGAVDGSDYSLIDYAYITDKTTPGALTGWFNGDFNYDGVINGSDYTLIDNAFNQQGSSLGSNPLAQISAQVAGSAVPEPATLSLLAIGSVGLLSRRKRRN